jgi:hypothetical protein
MRRGYAVLRLARRCQRAALDCLYDARTARAINAMRTSGVPILTSHGCRLTSAFRFEAKHHSLDACALASPDISTKPATTCG